MIDDHPDEQEALLQRLRELRASEDALTDELVDFRPLVVRANHTARRAKIVAIIGVVVAVIGVIIGVGGWLAQRDANQSTDAARRAGCIQHNVQAKDVSEKLVNGLKAFFDDPANPTGEEQAALDVYAAATKPVYRDCSKAGIEAYIDNPPADPALEP